MKVIDYNKELLPQLTKLVNFHIGKIPPFFELTDSQVEIVLENAGEWWWKIKRPYKELYKNISCIIEDGKLIAAMEWAQYESDDIDYPYSKEDCCINWLFTYPENKKSLKFLFDHVGVLSNKIGCKQFSFSARFHFGVGWMGIPESWNHIVEGLIYSGFRIRGSDILMTKVVSSEKMKTNLDINYKLKHRKNEQTLETITECRLKNGELIGECWAWELPPYLTNNIKRLQKWVSIESIEVNEKYRRKGIGTKLLQSQIDYLNDIENIILTAETDEDAPLFYKKLNFKDEDKLYLFSDKEIQ